MNDLASLEKTIKDIWAVLGITAYEDAMGKTIVELVADKVAENAKLKEALEDYGEHSDNCGVRWTLRRPKVEPCDCGLQKALTPK